MVADTSRKRIEDIRPLPGKVVAIFDLRQYHDESPIAIPDSVLAKDDRAGRGRLRWATVIVSGDDDIHPGRRWLVDPNAGQWWSQREARDILGVEIPDYHQLRFYDADAFFACEA